MCRWFAKAEPARPWWGFWQGSLVFVAEGCIVSPLSEEMCVSYVENGSRVST